MAAFASSSQSKTTAGPVKRRIFSLIAAGFATEHLQKKTEAR